MKIELINCGKKIGELEFPEGMNTESFKNFVEIFRQEFARQNG